DGNEFDRLVWTNEAATSFEYLPLRFRLTVDVARWRGASRSFDAIQLHLPPSWVTDLPRWRPSSASIEHLEWVISPRLSPDQFGPQILVEALLDGEVQCTAFRSLPVEI